ncbi:DUF4426 domain-containing protein [Marinagarivorans algicola]|uniref:DUF4426 domain-containing protein n=1 Tax=Marinagarivorans algicola TaxID=1513270 RepID=UPI0006B54F75|nr:DUF4426 domain-containing protein [Marinagarivorans algicola]
MFYAHTFISTLKYAMVAIVLLCVNRLYAADLDQESTQVFGDYTVHYTAFNSTFIQPDIAAHYGITRGKNQTLINISVHDKTGKAVDAKLDAYAQNLMQQKKPLTFKTITEQAAIYSIAPLRITNEEVFNFHITVTPPQSKPFTLKFTRKLYVEP